MNLKLGKVVKWPSYWTTFEGGYESDQRDSDNEDPFSSGEDFDSGIRTQKRRKKLVYHIFNEKTDMIKVELVVGLRFTSRDVFKEAVLAYSIQQHKDLVHMKNDKRFISIGCANCRWELTSGPDLEDPTGWQIKSMQPVHEWCTRTFENRLITENWLVKEYLDRILRNSLIKEIEIKADMRARYDIVVGIRQCQRAKLKALNAVQSLMKKQYGILKPYLKDLVKSNPGTTCVLKTFEGEANQPKQFLRFYVCFAALKKSFIENCRPIIGLDGCFLKHACGGQLLSAVGRDANNHMFPIGWAVVERETTSSWDWFLKFISEDLKMEDGEGWTVVSAQQKVCVFFILFFYPSTRLYSSYLCMIC